MNLKIYQIDAFTNHLFGGNPAAVVPLQKWLSDDVMQKIAAENNLAETAFFVKENNDFAIRWFTPTNEVPLCGHATLASAYTLFEHLNYTDKKIVFNSLSGKLIVEKKDNLLCLNFPADIAEEIDIHTFDKNVLQDSKIINVLLSPRFYMLVLANEKAVKEAKPNFDAIKKLDRDALIITAKGNQVDFVSRFFAPQIGVNEDPVTGAAHTTLIPYWAKILNKKTMQAQQLSPRIGNLFCTFLNERVEIAGNAVTYLVGEISI